jgi:conjugative transfer pilus assembly protein TraH
MKRSAILLVIANLVIPRPSGANLDQDLDRMFLGMSNVTPPTAQMGQRRGVLSGGSVVIRNRIMKANPVTLTPPGFSGGCGGIDLYGGSFSFINQSEFTGLLRSIAANAGGYAFQLGINAMCPDCGSLMSDLQKKVQSLNEHLANSCQLAQGIVNDGFLALDAQQRSRLSQWSLSKGLGDAFQSFTGVTGDPIDRAVNADPSAFKRTQTGNLIWRALHQNTQGRGGALGGDEWLEAIMSVTGTLIIQPPSTDPGFGGHSLPVLRLPPLIGIRELIQGKQPDPAQENETRIYHCDEGSGDGCLHPVTVSFEMRGFIARIESVLGGSDGTTGILFKFATGQGSFTPEELSFMDQAPQSLGALIRNLAREDPALARHFVQEAGPILAVAMAGDLVEEMMETTRESGRIETHPYQRLIDESLDQTLSKLRDERRSLENRWGTIGHLVTHYQTLMQTGRSRDYGVGGSLAAGARKGSS